MNFNGSVLAALAESSFIYTGEGSVLKCRSDVVKILGSLPNGTAIHEIYKINEGNVVFFGGKELGIYQESTRKQRTIILQDWIHSIHWTPDGNLFCLLAHNIVVKIPLVLDEDESRETLVEDVYHCEEKCILYSGHILGETTEHLVILCGTVFQEIVIWGLQSRTGTGDCKVLHRLRGHQGVIFSVTYSHSKQLICSTSDDRSVRTWSVDFADSDIHDWSNASIQPQLVLHGHSARVWRSLLLENRLVSAGEDSYICLWSYKGELVDRWLSHEGASLRSVTYSKETGILYSTGDDGGIHAWNIADRFPIVPTAVQFPSLKDEHPSNILFLPTSFLLVVTNQGRLFLETSSGFDETLVGMKTHNVTLVKISEDFLCFGSMDGKVQFYRLDSLKTDKAVATVQLADGLLSVVWIDGTNLLTCGRDGAMEILSVCSEVNRRACLTLPLSKERVATSACWVNGTQALVVGDRDGSVILYADIGLQREPLHYLRNIHGKHGVSDVTSPSPGIIFSSGRDGSVRTYRFSEEKRILITTHVHNSKVGWVARFLPEEMELSFYGNQFQVRSRSEDRVLVSMPCGGAQRCWDYHLADKGDTFAFIKERTVYRCKVNRSAYHREVIKPGFHTRIINTALVEPLPQPKCCLLVTGSEDTTIRLTCLEDCNVLWSKKYNIHRSSVRAVAVHRFGEEEAFLVSGGGRAELCVSRVSLKGPETNLMLQTSHLLRGLHAKGFDPETRYNSLAIAVPSLEGFQVFVACSDGAVRRFSYTLSTQSLNLLSQSEWHNHCVLQVKLMAGQLLSSGTDGRIAVWNVQSFPTPQPESESKLHQSGVNCIDWFSVADDTFVSSCGDDNALCMRRVNGGETWRNDSAHAATVTGLKVLDEDNLLTVSADQRLAHWKLLNNTFQLKLMKQDIMPRSNPTNHVTEMHSYYAPEHAKMDTCWRSPKYGTTNRPYMPPTSIHLSWKEEEYTGDSETKMQKNLYPFDDPIEQQKQ